MAGKPFPKGLTKEQISHPLTDPRIVADELKHMADKIRHLFDGDITQGDKKLIPGYH